MSDPWPPIGPGSRSAHGSLSLLATSKCDGESDVASGLSQGQSKEHLPVESIHFLFLLPYKLKEEPGTIRREGDKCCS